MSGGISQLHTAELDEVDETPRFVEFGGDESEWVLDALGSDTAREVYEQLQEAPATPSTLAEATGRSLQTMSYHLSNLEEAGLIESAGVRYSDQGQEMTVWAPANGSIVLVDDAERARETMARHLAAVLALGVVSVLVQRVADRFVAATPTGGSSLQPTSYGPSNAVDGFAQSLAQVLTIVDPGAVVFAVGLVVLAVVRFRD